MYMKKRTYFPLGLMFYIYSYDIYQYFKILTLLNKNYKIFSRIIF